MDNAIALIVYWGVWLLIPIVVDGLTTIYTLIGVSLVHLQNRRNQTPPLQSYPLVTIIIPVTTAKRRLKHACDR